MIEYRNIKIRLFSYSILFGVASTFSLFWPKIQKSLVGVAISVALIPPIVMCGIGFAQINKEIISESAFIVLINLFGIVLGSLVTMTFVKNRILKIFKDNFFVYLINAVRRVKVNTKY